jgi:hypothetical protein
MPLIRVDDAQFLVVIPFCAKDVDLAWKQTELIARLNSGKKTEADCLLTWDNQTPKDKAARVKAQAERYFRRVFTYVYPAPPQEPWPRPQNAAFQRTCVYLSLCFNCPWLWLEPDATPLRPDWLDMIMDEYKKGGQPFMGHIVEGMGHVNGCAVYPPKIEWHAQAGLRCTDVAFDVAMKKEMQGKVHKANHIIQHHWEADPNSTMANWSKAGLVTFPTWESVDERVDFRCAFHHRCKDGTLIDRIIEHNWGGESESTINVPQHTPPPTLDEPSKPILQPRNQRAVLPKVEIFYVTYQRDLSWVAPSLESIDLFAKGFAGVTMLVPNTQLKVFEPICKKHSAKLIGFDEMPGKGMVHHMVMLMSADKFVPRGTTHVLHLDPDCIFFKPTHVSDYFTDGKPHWVVRTYASLTGANGLTSDCAQWEKVTEKALGYPPVWYTMCRHPSIFCVDLYAGLRNHITDIQGKPFEDYVLSCKNEFPQTFAEFPTMGAWAIKAHPDRWFWIDVSQGLAPKDRLKVYWSHAGLDQRMEDGRTAREQIKEAFAQAQKDKPKRGRPRKKK